MAFGMKCENVLVRSTSFGRKRVALPNIMDLDDFISTTPTKKLRAQNSFSSFDKSLLEVLPQDILIRIVCGVDHDDLKRLFHVSRAIREATLVAKRWHFEYSTPKKTVGFKNAIDMEEDLDEPNAPRQMKALRSRLNRKKLADISVALFKSDGEEHCQGKELFM